MTSSSDSPLRRAKRVGIRDVARLAGVAPMTVSRALSFPHLVLEETREKIAHAIAQSGYIPNRVAGSLSSNQTMTIGAVIPTLHNSIPADFVEGLSTTLRASGYQLLLGNSRFRPEDEEAIVTEYLARRVDGIYLTGGNHTERTRKLLRDNAVPTVEVVSLLDDPIDMAVGYSNFDAAYELTRILVDRGHRKIALMANFRKDNDRQAERRLGYEAAVRDFALDDDPALIVELAMDLSQAADTLHEILARRPDVEALLCTGEFIAAGALFEAQRLGIRVPQDLAIAGFEAVELAENVNPTITTIWVPRYDIGARAGALLLDRIAGRAVADRVVDMGYRILKRESTGSARPPSPSRPRAQS
jgi:LacI family transcriptional regulator, gluconate utilization system Gnt-I transcriptional repressor